MPYDQKQQLILNTAIKKYRKLILDLAELQKNAPVIFLGSYIQYFRNKIDFLAKEDITLKKIMDMQAELNNATAKIIHDAQTKGEQDARQLLVGKLEQLEKQYGLKSKLAATLKAIEFESYPLKVREEFCAVLRNPVTDSKDFSKKLEFIVATLRYRAELNVGSDLLPIGIKNAFIKALNEDKNPVSKALKCKLIKATPLESILQNKNALVKAPSAADAKSSAVGVQKVETRNQQQANMLPKNLLEDLCASLKNKSLDDTKLHVTKVVSYWKSKGQFLFDEIDIIKIIKSLAQARTDMGDKPTQAQKEVIRDKLTYLFNNLFSGSHQHMIVKRYFEYGLRETRSEGYQFLMARMLYNEFYGNNEALLAKDAKYFIELLRKAPDGIKKLELLRSNNLKIYFPSDCLPDALDLIATQDAQQKAKHEKRHVAKFGLDPVSATGRHAVPVHNTPHAGLARVAHDTRYDTKLFTPEDFKHCGIKKTG